MYKVAIIGLGNIAWQYSLEGNEKNGSKSHLSAYQHCKQTKVVAACDPDEKTRAQFKKNCPEIELYSSPRELIENETVDIFSICSPSDLHFEHCLLALEASPKAIWLEKPPVTGEISQLKELIKKSEETSTKVLVNYTRRYSKPYLKLKNFFDDEEVKSIRVSYSRGLETNGSHLIDILTFLCPESEKFQLKGIIENKENPSALFSYNDIPITITGIDLDFHCLDFELTSNSKRMNVKYSGSELVTESKVENPDFPGFYLFKVNSTEKFDSPGSLMNEVLSDLISAIDKPERTKSNLYSSLSTIKLIEQMRSH